MLEELANPKEERCRLGGPKCFANVKEVDDLCQKDPTFARADGRLVKDAGLLNDRRLVLEEDAHYCVSSSAQLVRKIAMQPIHPSPAPSSSFLPNDMAAVRLAR